MSVIVVIPARYGSTRFPGKPLAPLKGKPLIQHVYQNASGSRLADAVFVATDNDQILNTVLSFGGKGFMTARTHQSGTDRIAEVVRSMNYDIIVNVQGDEPLIQPDMIDDVITLHQDKKASIGTLAKRIQNPEEISDPNVVKVVFDNEWFALYFSRSSIPYHRDEWTIENEAMRMQNSSSENIPLDCYKHIGMYSYKRDVLIRLSEMPPSRLEQIEKLEQLRALENGFKIKVKETALETIGVDTPEDLERIEEWLNLSL